MPAGQMPRRTPHADHGDRWARVLAASGTPLSVRRRHGRPNSLHTRANTGLAAATLVEDRAWQRRSKRLSPSVLVSGEPLWPSPVVKGPMKSALRTSFGAAMALVGWPGGPMTRRLRVLGTPPWRLRMAQTGERAGQGQQGWRLYRLDHGVVAPQDGCRPRASRSAATTWSGAWRGEGLGRRERSSRPCGPCMRERSIPLAAVLRLTPESAQRAVPERRSRRESAMNGVFWSRGEV